MWVYAFVVLLLVKKVVVTAKRRDNFEVTETLEKRCPMRSRENERNKQPSKKLRCGQVVRTVGLRRIIKAARRCGA